MTTAGAIALVVWLVGSAAVLVAVLVLLRRAGARTLEAAALAWTTAIFGPGLVAQWIWLVPMSANGHVNATGVVCAAVGGSVLARAGRPFDVLPPRVETRVVIESAVVVAATTAVAGFSLLVAVLRPVEDWDAMMYHGPTIANLVNASSLFGWELGSAFGFYPSLTAVLATPVAAALESTRFADAAQILPWTCLVLVGWSWAGRGRPRLVPGIVIVMAASAPPIFTQLRSLSVDVAYAACLLASLYAAMLWWERRQAILGVVVTVSFAAAIATKPSGAILSVWVVLLLLAIAAVRRRRHWLYAVGAVLIAGLLGSPMYLRNLIEHGNPAYPVIVEAGPLRFDGTIELSRFYEGSQPRFGDLPPVISFLRNLVEGIVDGPASYNWNVAEGGYWTWPLWLGAITAVAVTTSVLRGSHRRFRVDASAVALAAGLVVIQFTQPQPWFPRYAIVPFMVIAIAVGMVAHAGLAGRTGGWPTARWALAATIVLVGAVSLRHVDRHFDAGFAVVDRARQSSPGYGDTFGASPIYGPGFTEVASAACDTQVVVDANQEQHGRYSTFSLALWGDRLCNDVRFVHQGSEPITVAMGELVTTADYVVIDETELDQLTRHLADLGWAAAPIAGPAELLGVSQYIVRIER